MAFTFTSCNAACWCAEEDDCHCVCGGANHGVYTRGNKAGISAGSLKPQMRRGDRIYQLEAIGDYFSYYKEFPALKKMVRDKEGNIDFIIQKANKAQIEKWPEVKAITQRYGSGIAVGNKIPYLLWKQVMTKEEFLNKIPQK